MAGLFGLSVSSCAESNFFPETLYWGTFYNRHLGEEYCGLAVCDNHIITCDARAGLFSPNFRGRMQEFKGLNGIGYCGSACEPFFVRSRTLGDFALCFSGNITNIEELFRLDNHPFQRGDDIEAIAHLLIRGRDFFEGVSILNKNAQGAWALLILAPRGIYAVRSPSGHWPLVIGKHKKEMAICICSEQTGFNNLDFDFTREVNSGETVFFERGYESLSRIAEAYQKLRQCSFYGVYTSSPAAEVHGVPATLIRKKLGACLAKKDIGAGLIPHIVMPVPDSGRFHAIGYHQEFCRQMMAGNIKIMPLYDEPLIKYGFSRSFLRPSKSEREKTAHYKIVITAETIKHFLKMLQEAGLREIASNILKEEKIIIVICEDSVVRGTQVASNIAPKVRFIYETNDIKAEIHVRASYPELLSHCTWGKTTKKGETLAERVPDVMERAKELGVGSIAYNTIDDLVAVLEVPRKDLCFACALKL